MNFKFPIREERKWDAMLSFERVDFKDGVSRSDTDHFNFVLKAWNLLNHLIEDIDFRRRTLALRAVEAEDFNQDSGGLNLVNSE